MDIPITLRQQIVKFLTALPNIHDDDNRRALIYSAGLDSELQGQIDFSGASEPFFQTLIETCLSYGKLQDGRHPLDATLEAAKQQVGTDKQALCDQLLQDFQILPSQEEVSYLLKEGNLKELREQCQPLEVYLATLQKHNSTMRVFGLPKPVPLDDIYVHVNILDKPSIFHHSSKEQLEASFLKNRLFDPPTTTQQLFKKQLEASFLKNRSFGQPLEKRKDGLETTRKHDYLFILGKPGSGKTTFLKHLVLQAIAGHLKRIPILITLKEFSTSGNTLKEYIREQFDGCGFSDTQGFVENLLNKGWALLLCDGLDEVTQAGGVRTRIISELKALMKKYHANQYLITCRIAATEYVFEQFTYVEITDFDDMQIQHFVKQWFKDDKEILSEFFQEFYKHRSLYELAQTPLLLSFLCVVFEELKKFPSKRSNLYQEALDILLKKWDSSRDIVRDDAYKGLSLKRKQQIFVQIAAETFEKGDYIFEQNFIEKTITTYLNHNIDEEAILKAIEAQHGILVERAKGLYSFLHLTFQEYFTARYILEHAHKGTLQRLIQNHCADTNWWEVFLLTVEMLDDTDEFFDIFLFTLESMIQQEKRIQDLLIQVEKEATTLQSDVTLFKKRWAIIYLIIDAAVAFTSASARADDPAFIGTLTFDIFTTGTFTSTIAIARDIATVIGSASFHIKGYFDSISSNIFTNGRNIFFAREMAYTIANTISIPAFTNIDTFFDGRIDDIIARIIKRSMQLGLKGLSHKLSTLSVPSDNASEEDWYTFIEILWEMFCTHFPTEDYTFTEEQANNITDYLAATELFIICLQNAYVSDREAIMEQLLRVPQ